MATFATMLLHGVLSGAAGVVAGVCVAHGLHSLRSRTVYHKYNNADYASYFAACFTFGGAACVVGSAVAVAAFGQNPLHMCGVVAAIQVFMHGVVPIVWF
jgi:hypothetical protein